MSENSTSLPGIKHFPIYIVYFTGGIIIGISNVVIFFEIARYEALRSSKVYVLIMAQTLADSIHLLAFALAGIRRSLLIFAGLHDTLYTIRQCAHVAHSIIWSFSGLLANVMLCVVSLDRLICVMSPLRYIGLTYRYTIALAGSAYLYSITCGAIGMAWALTNDDQSPIIGAKCITFDIYGKLHPLYDFHFNQAPVFWTVLSICIYTAVWIIHKRQNAASVVSIASGATGLIWVYSTRDEQLQTIGAKCIGHNVFAKVHPFYDLHFNQAPILWAFLSVCIYVAVWIIYKRQNAQVSHDNQGQQHQMEHQRKFTKSLGISCLCSFFLFIVPRQLGNIANKLGSRSVAMAFWTSANLNPFANVFIYVTRHEEIRQALKGLFTCKHMPSDVKTWKANREASKAPKKGLAAARTNEQHPNQVAVQEL